jgi:hypothetical protein
MRRALWALLGSLVSTSCVRDAPRAVQRGPVSSSPRAVAEPEACVAVAAPAGDSAVSDPTAANPGSDQTPVGWAAKLLAAAADLQAIALFRSGDDDRRLPGPWRILSATADDGSAASCLATPTAVRCINFAGYSRDHLVDVFAREHYPAVATPIWAPRVLATDHDRDPRHSAWTSIQVHLDGPGPVLGVDDDDGVQFAVRRAGRWHLSPAFSGGKTREPFYFEAIDLTAATHRPSIGLVLGHYLKESCVRYEQDELVVLAIDDELAELGRVVIGAAAWIATAHGRYGPFDPEDPDHYLLRLAPRLRPDGTVQLDVAARQVPDRWRKQGPTCGVELPVHEVDQLRALVGPHSLPDLLRRGELERARQAE